MNAKQIIFIVFFLIALGIFAWTVSKLWKYFKVTKPESRYDRIGERLMHTLIVGIGQKKIFRFGVAGGLHATIFWGFIVITVGTLEMMIDGIFNTHRALSFLGPIYDLLTVLAEVFAAAIILAAVIFLVRRYVVKPGRFQAVEMKPSSRRDATFVLALTMLLMISLLQMNIGYYLLTGGMGEGLYPVSALLAPVFAGLSIDALYVFHEIGWWIHIFLVLLFLNFLPYSKHFHVMLSLPNVFFKRLGPAGRLNNLDSITKEVKMMMDPNADPYATPAEGEQEEIGRFGVSDLKDLTWKNLMDAYTCTECGRCTSVCPANTTGKKLSPRKIFIDVRARMKKMGPAWEKDPAYDDGKSLLDFITPEELWACTTCGACMEECPVEIEHVPLIVDMRRYLVMEKSAAPQQLNIMFTNIENNGAPWAMPASSRFDWANNLEMAVV